MNYVCQVHGSERTANPNAHPTQMKTMKTHSTHKHRGTDYISVASFVAFVFVSDRIFYFSGIIFQFHISNLQCASIGISEPISSALFQQYNTDFSVIRFTYKFAVTV